MAVLAVVGLLAYGLISKGNSGLEIGAAVPSERLTVLGTEKPAQLADLRGKWVLLNVWASWCGPCKEESPALQQFSDANAGKVTVVGVDTQDNSQDALGFVRDYGIRYPQWHDADASYADDLGTTGFPESFLVSPSGKLVAHYPGPFGDEKAVNVFAAPALGSKE